MKKRIISIITIIFFSLCIIIIDKNTKHTSSPTVFSGFYFDTFIEITIYDNAPSNITKDIENICNTYELIFSESNINSQLYSLNHTDSFSITEDIYTVLSCALDFARKTDGLLDPTIYKVSKLWAFDGSNPIPPTKEAINDQLSFVGYENVSLTQSSITKPLDTELALGYIAKGYIADKIKDYLLSKGIKNALINLGGNIICMGVPANSSNYSIGLQYPFKPNEAYTTLHITDKSIVTSGIYERYFNYNGKLYHHILDTHTGYPIENNILSVSIIGDSSMICDALSTTLYILGTDNGAEFIGKYYPDYEYLFILNDYSNICSEGFNTYL